MGGINGVVVHRVGNHDAMGVVQELAQAFKEQAEWHQCRILLVHDSFHRFLEQGQHRPCTFRQVLTIRAVGPDRCKHILQQVKLIRNERIRRRKIFP